MHGQEIAVLDDRRRVLRPIRNTPVLQYSSSVLVMACIGLGLCRHEKSTVVI